MSEKRQKNQIEVAFTYSPKGEARKDAEEGTEALVAEGAPEDPTGSQRLMEAVCETENLKRALRRVKGNKGSPGVDGMRVERLGQYLIGHWGEIRDGGVGGEEPRGSPLSRLRELQFPLSWITEATIARFPAASGAPDCALRPDSP